MIPETSETQTEGFPYEIFRHRETKYFRRKIVILLCIKFFDTPNFLKFSSDAREFFRHCETIIIRRKNVIPPVMHKIFRYPKFSETLKGCPRNVLALWDQNFSTENRDTPSSLPPFLSIIFFSIPDFFWYTDQRGSPTKFFSTETKKISTKLWDKSLKHKIFRYPKLVTHWRFPLRNFSGTVRQTFFDGKSWYSLLPSPLLSISFFDTRNFLKQKRVPLRSIFGTVRQQYFF